MMSAAAMGTQSDSQIESLLIFQYKIIGQSGWFKLDAIRNRRLTEEELTGWLAATESYSNQEQLIELNTQNIEMMKVAAFFDSQAYHCCCHGRMTLMIHDHGRRRRSCIIAWHIIEDGAHIQVELN